VTCAVKFSIAYKYQTEITHFLNFETLRCFFIFIFPVFETLTDNENEYNCSLMDAVAQQKILQTFSPKHFTSQFSKFHEIAIDIWKLKILAKLSRYLSQNEVECHNVCGPIPVCVCVFNYNYNECHAMKCSLCHNLNPRSMIKTSL
jgi:hypothetical protein